MPPIGEELLADGDWLPGTAANSTAGVRPHTPSALLLHRAPQAVCAAPDTGRHRPATWGGMQRGRP